MIQLEQRINEEVLGESQYTESADDNNISRERGMGRGCRKPNAR